MGGMKKVKRITYGQKWVIFEDYGTRIESRVFPLSISESELKRMIAVNYPQVQFCRDRVENGTKKKKADTAPAAPASAPPQAQLPLSEKKDDPEPKP